MMALFSPAGSVINNNVIGLIRQIVIDDWGISFNVWSIKLFEIVSLLFQII